MKKALSVLLFILFGAVCVFGQTPNGGYTSPATGGGSISPSQLPAGVQKANTISATDYGVKADTQYVTTATLTGGSSAVVLSASGPQFVAGDVGKICFSGNYGGGTGNYIAGTVLALSAGTITSVTDGTHATCGPSTAIGGVVAAASFVWGSDDTAALAAAWNAAANIGTGFNCKTLILPTGAMLTTTGQFNTSLCSTRVVVPGDKPMSIWGQGIRSTLIIPVGGNFSFNHSTSCNGTGSGIVTGTCFFGVDGLSVNNLAIYGAGWDNTTAVAGTGIMYIGTDGYFANTDCIHFGAADTNLIGIVGSGGSTQVYNINNNGCGAVGFRAFGLGNALFNSYICCNLTSGVVVTSGTSVNLNASAVVGSGCGGSTLDISGTGSAILNDQSTVSSGCSTGNLGAINVAGTGKVFWSGLGAASGTAGNVTGISVGSTAQLFSQGVTYAGTGTGVGMSLAAGAKYFDLGGNIVQGGFFPAGTLFGSPSIGGTLQVAGNFAVGAGMGTSTFGTVSGDSLHGQVTVTYAGALATPATFTMTFPKAFLLAPICTVEDMGGTNPFPTQIDLVNTPSTTTLLTVKMTFAAAPVATQTDTFVWNCGH